MSGFDRLVTLKDDICPQCGKGDAVLEFSVWEHDEMVVAMRVDCKECKITFELRYDMVYACHAVEYDRPDFPTTVDGMTLHDDDFKCECGDYECFDPCLENGALVEPDKDGPWVDLYKCCFCNKIWKLPKLVAASDPF